MTPSQTPVWFVTGAGRGLGRALAVAALDAGERVVATVRTPSALDDLRAAHPDALHVVDVDVREREAVVDAVGSGASHFGRLDVVVNNAGYGLVGTIEEVSEADARSIVDTDLLGALWVSQAALPWLRAQGHGHLVQISTTGAVGAVPTFGLYNAAKWGLEGFTQAMAGEVARFGIRVTIAQLGGFDTDWAGASMRFAAPLSAYDDLRTELFGSPTVPWAVPDGEVLGAPVRTAVTVLRAHVAAADGPLRLLVGDDAPDQVTAALQIRCDDYGRDPRFRRPAAHPGAEEGARG